MRRTIPLSMSASELSPSEPPAPPPLPDTADVNLLAALIARGEHASSKRSSNTVLLITIALFVGLGGFYWGWHRVLYLLVAIALHEIGHVIAMRAFGYKNVRMLFIPLFGGLATGEPRESDAAKNAMVALAGPAFGLVTAAAAIALAYALGSPPMLVEFAWISLLLNAFNLLPLVPLDGGQVANDTLFSRYPVLELIFRLLAVAALGWLAFALQAWVLALLPVFLLISTPLAYRRACLIRDARLDPSWQTRPLDLEAAARLRAIVATLFKSVAPSAYEKKLPEHAHGLWMDIRKRFPGPGRTTALLAAYLTLCLIVVPVIAMLLVVGFESPVFAQ